MRRLLVLTAAAAAGSSDGGIDPSAQRPPPTPAGGSSDGGTDPAAAAAPPFHVVRSTRWPCLQFNMPCTPVGSNAFAGALIMCNDTAVDKDGLVCCSAQHYADPLDPLCYTSPAEVRDALAVVPTGQKLIGVVDGESDMGGPTLSYAQFWDPIDGGRFRGPWGDNMTAFVGARWRRWMAEYKKQGGQVDVLHVDAEWSLWYISRGFAAQRSHDDNQTGVWTPVAADPRWPALQARLNARGHGLGADFMDISDMDSWPLNSTADLRAHVWDSVMFERMAEIVNASYFEPIRESFPAVKCSNYGHTYTPPAELWTFMSGTSEGHPPFTGSGAHVGTHQAKSFYTPSQGFQTECAVEVGPSSRMGFCWSWGTPFWERKLVAEPLDYAVLLWSTTRIRGIVAANPQVPVTPWLEPKNSVTYPYPGGSYLANSDMYQEMVLHMTLTGVSEFLLWHAGPPRCCFCGRLGACSDGEPCDAVTCPDPPSNRTESITVGVDVLNGVLAEADAVAGAAGRTALVLDAPQASDPFVLSGVEILEGWMLAGDAALTNTSQQVRVYRFTPRDASSTKVVSEVPASFQLPGVMGIVVPVPNGRLYRSPKPSSTAGFWTVADTSTAKLKIDDDEVPRGTAPPPWTQPRAEITVCAASAGLRIYYADAMLPGEGNHAAPAPAVNAVTLSASRQQRVDFQLVLTSVRTPRTVLVTTPDNNNGRSSTGTLSVRTVARVNVTLASNAAGRTGLWPDPLVESAGSVQLLEGSASVWITLSIPATARKSLSGVVTVTDADTGVHLCSIPYIVHVWQFTVPNASDGAQDTDAQVLQIAIEIVPD